MNKKFPLILAICLTTSLVSCADDGESNKKVQTQLKVNSHMKEEVEEIQQKEFFVDAKNQNMYSSKIVETQKDYFYSSLDDNNRIYRKSKNNSNKDSEISMMSGNYLIQDEEKIYYSNSQENGKIYYFDSDKFDENLEPIKFNNYKSRDLVVTKDGIFYINQDDYEKIYFTSFDGKIEKAVTQDRAPKFIISDNTIYYQNANDGYKLYCINFDDKEKIMLSDFSVESFCTVNGLLLVSNSDDADSLYIVNTNKNIKKISNIKAIQLKTDIMSDTNSRESFYFVDESGEISKAQIGKDLKMKNIKILSSELTQDYHFTKDKVLIQTQDEQYKAVKK